ncbi:MAG: glycosyltransferase [Lachnospiraceae bacterium]|nr:glycosyltransferase [Lachnospiraceae bacterium]
MAKVSVIVPAYNCEKTLAQCLGNLVHQSLSDIEIIIVNDASTDGTWDVITRCEAQFSDKVMAINSTENKGAGGARNVGLMYASGEYIGFVDSDDIVATDMYEKLYNKAKMGNYDIVDCGYYNEEKNSSIVHASDELTGDLDGYKRSELIVSGGYLWSHLFKRELIVDSGIVFRENVILEDCEYLMYMFAIAKRVGNVKEVLYNYRCFDTSASKYVNPDKYYKNATAAMDAVHEKMSALSNYEEIKMAVEYVIIQLASYTTNMSLVYGAKEKNYDAKEKVKTVYEKMMSYITIPIMENEYVRNKIKEEDLRILLR